MFERIKFLEAFNNKKPFAKDNVDTELGELLHQYQPAYEDRLDPFRLFFQNVKAHHDYYIILTNYNCLGGL